MTYVGTVRNGVIILPPNVALPEGAEVDVTPRTLSKAENLTEDDKSFAAAARQLSKSRTHLPADYALNHGHYVRGEPKK